MRACLSSLLLGLFALQRSLGSPSTAGLGLNTHAHNRTRLPVGPVLNAHAHNRTRLSAGSVLNAHAQNRTKLPEGGKDPHHRPKRGWVWNQFYVLEEHIGPEPQYVGKVRAAIVCSQKYRDLTIEQASPTCCGEHEYFRKVLTSNLTTVESRLLR